ncbi:Uncharacterized protein ImpA [plant metagenome]|uniref:Uncharacterized protein ImpA n=1 Tax=plant metagenome TaxID=1297885 RepID=A0A484TI88_9ZZZZ
MTTDINTLLQPIPGDAPAGEDMVFSAEFDEIREARRQDDPHLDQGDWVTDIKEADWHRVARVCAEVLSTRSKDLRVAGWLAEAWAKTRGFPGLRDGLLLVDGLCRDYWDTVHPVPEDGDAQQRVGNLAWLLSRSRQLVTELPLTDTEGGRYGAAVWDSASALANSIRREPQRANDLSQGRVTMEQYDQARRDTPATFYLRLEQDLHTCAQAVDALEATLTERLGDEGPAFSPLRTSLRQVSDLTRRFAREAGLAERSEPAAAPAAAVPDSASARIEPTLSPALGAPATVPAAPAPIPGPLQSREQALAQLRDVAAFFRRTEPHSPVAYLADKAADWGEMSLHLWLRTVLKNEETLSALEEILGVARKPSDGN